MTIVDITGRRRAREAALQMLYQIGDRPRRARTRRSRTYWPAHDAGRRRARRAAAGVRQRAGARHARAASPEIDAIIAAHAQNWRIERMAVIDRLVLRLAVYELLAEPDTPPRVVINEALELGANLSAARRPCRSSTACWTPCGRELKRE